MSKPIKKVYLPVEKLQIELAKLNGMRFTLNCGHHITFGHNFGTDVIVHNAKIPRIICTECGL